MISSFLIGVVAGRACGTERNKPHHSVHWFTKVESEFFEDRDRQSWSLTGWGPTKNIGIDNLS